MPPHPPFDPGIGDLRREALLSAVVAAVFAALLVRLAPAGPDVPAHLFQRRFLLEHGYSLWNNLWYAGQYDFVTYSLIYYPLAALLGLGTLVVLSVSGAVGAFTQVVLRSWGRPARWSSAGFMLVWPGVVLTGAFPFALGMATALAGGAALQRRRHGACAALAVATLAASPLAFLFMALPLGAWLVVHRVEWRRVHRPLAIIALAIVVELALWRLFPSGGSYPFRVRDLVDVCAFAGLGAVFSWRVERLRTLRWLFLAYGAACAVLFVIPFEIGSNVTRVRLAALPIALLVVGVRWWRPLSLCLVMVALAGWWNAGAFLDSYARSSSDESSKLTYWQPSIDWLHGRLSSDYRVEAVDTSGHWPAAYLPAAGIPLARGWFRQADFPLNDLLYHPLAAGPYLTWLRRLGVQYVVLSDAAPDYSAIAEATLLRSGRSGLKRVLRAGSVVIYAVPHPRPIVTGPGTPTVTELTAAGLVIDIDRPGTFAVAVRWSPYWRSDHGCLAPTPDGMIELTTPASGPVDLDFRVDAVRALRVLGRGSGAECHGSSSKGTR